MEQFDSVCSNNTLPRYKLQQPNGFCEKMLREGGEEEDLGRLIRYEAKVLLSSSSSSSSAPPFEHFTKLELRKGVMIDQAKRV